MVLTRRWSAFLVLVGLFSLAVWPRFAVAIWQDPRSWSDAAALTGPTSFLWVHAVLIVSAIALGLLTGYLGVRGLLAGRARSVVPPQPAARR